VYSQDEFATFKLVSAKMGCGELSVEDPPVACTVCVGFGRNLHSKMLPLGFTPLLRLKRCHVCDQQHSARVFTPLTGSHCKLRPNTEGPLDFNGEAQTEFVVEEEVRCSFFLLRFHRELYRKQ
jgi:hypothetical protein